MDIKQSGRMPEPTPQTMNGGPVNHNAKRKSVSSILVSKGAFLLAAIVVLIVVFFAVSNLSGAKPASGRYQSVFLNSGQVYFGKLKNVNGKYLTLEDAYFSKGQELPANATAEQKAATSNNVTLVKVGQEVYGPENTMYIRADQVVFWQDLKTDSKVSKAIDSANK